jgi:uncharacterized protein with GYD domain
MGLMGIGEFARLSRLSPKALCLAEAGGSLESFHFALGQDDAYIICDLPDNVTAAAVSTSAEASGMLVSRMVALLTAEEVDRAAAMKLQFDPPGS